MSPDYFVTHVPDRSFSLRTTPGAVAQRLAGAAYMWDYRSRPRTQEEVKAERKRKAAYMICIG